MPEMYKFIAKQQHYFVNVKRGYTKWIDITNYAKYDFSIS